MLFFRNLLKLPSPVDLGWSKYNALASAQFSDDPKGKTWENWHETVKEMHPVKYWIAETAADFVRYKIWFPIKRPFEKAHYYVMSHIFYRYHMLDLRQSCYKRDVNGVGNCYRYGWCDVPDKMLYAMFNLLGEYLNKEEPADLTNWYTREQIDADEVMKSQQAAIDEAKAIYHWWTVVRHEEECVREKLLHDWSEARKNKTDNKNNLWDMLQVQEKNNEDKIEEMISRLIKIRRTLWT